MDCRPGLKRGGRRIAPVRGRRRPGGRIAPVVPQRPPRALRSSALGTPDRILHADAVPRGPRRRRIPYTRLRPARATAKWKECADEYTVALSKSAAESYRATVPAPLVRELGRPARITFRRSGNLTVVAPSCPGGAAAGAPPPADARWREDGAPSETSLEVNILRYLANCLERRRGLAEGAVVPVSPTQPMERWLGFDAIVGLPRGRYVALQFKRPEHVHGSARFELGDRQAMTLLRYPRGSAFYVLPPARTNGEMSGLGRCLLHRARLVDAWDVLAPIAASRGAARAASGGGSARGCWGTRSAYVDGDEVHVQAGSAPRRPPCLPVPSAAASTLCDDADGVGFGVRDGRIVARGGAKWGLDGWRAEAWQALGAAGGRARRLVDGSWREDELDRAFAPAGDRPGQPALEEAESSFFQAFDRDGPGGDGGESGGTYWIGIAGVP